MRGSSSKYPYTDDMPENQPYSDPFFVDSYVVIRGEAQVLYLNANGVGMVAKYTKKPLPYQQTIVTGAVTDWGGTRATLDTTGPIGQFGEVKLSYRFDAVQQGPSYYFYNVHEDREGLYPVIQAQINQTIVRFYHIFVDDVHSPTGEDIVKPNGKLYTGAGPREANVPPNDMEHFEMHRTHVLLDTKATDNWEFRFAASYWRGISAGPVIETNSYNWATQTENFFSNEREITTDYWTMIGDASGKWNIGTLSQQDNFGYSYTDQLTHHYTPPTPEFVTGAINVPLNSVAAINALVVPPSSAYPGIGSPGTTVATHTQTYDTGIYWQHQMDIVPKYLTAVLGWTWATISSDSVGNVAVRSLYRHRHCRCALDPPLWRGLSSDQTAFLLWPDLNRLYSAVRNGARGPKRQQPAADHLHRKRVWLQDRVSRRENQHHVCRLQGQDDEQCGVGSGSVSHHRHRILHSGRSEPGAGGRRQHRAFPDQ